MTYRELYEEAFWDLQVSGITPEEFEERVKPLNQEPTSAIEELEKVKAEIKPLRYGSDTYKYAIDDVLEILDKHISELKGENK